MRKLPSTIDVVTTGSEEAVYVEGKRIVSGAIISADDLLSALGVDVTVYGAEIIKDNISDYVIGELIVWETTETRDIEQSESL